ncbi:MAG TPA: GPW/gp25 family protein [Pyrinomonadaceae bacterium]|nr:GPW/gp25 family protein [Pyrinomonadaceae bacterium]
MNLDFPFLFDSRGQTAQAGYDAHVRDMIEQVIFTNPGERVNRPDFGSGLLQLIFAPNSSELAATVEFAVKAAVQRWLGDVLDLQQLEVNADGETLTIEIDYVVRRTAQRQSATLTRTL